MKRALFKALCFPLGFLVGGMAAYSVVSDVVSEPTAASQTSKPQTQAEILTAKHDCWVFQAPKDMAGKIPGHTVVTVDGKTFYGGPVWVGKALDHTFNAKYPKMHVHSYCR